MINDPRRATIENEARFVCSECFFDDGIRNFINNRAAPGYCWYCDCRATITSVVSLDDLVCHIESCLSEEYSRAVDILGWSSEMGGYIGETRDSYELLFDTLRLSDNCKRSERLLQDLADLLPEDLWCDRSAYGLDDDEIASFDWQAFREVVMYHRRFFFADFSISRHGEKSDSPSETLRRLFDYAQHYSLMTELPVGTPLFRARWQRDVGQINTPRDLGPPPRKKATQSNRMSPPGIVMFYASDHQETALREIAESPGEFIVGRFEATRPIIVLDLTKIPPIPSLFQEIPEHLGFRPRQVLRFLNHIGEAISQPIQRDRRTHIEYVPTQVVTEYVRSRLTWNNESIDGIKYLSSVHSGHGSYVLFATQADVCGDLSDREWVRDGGAHDPWLTLAEKSHQSITQLAFYRWKNQAILLQGEDSSSE